MTTNKKICWILICFPINPGGAVTSIIIRDYRQRRRSTYGQVTSADPTSGRHPEGLDDCQRPNRVTRLLLYRYNGIKVWNGHLLPVWNRKPNCPS